MRETCARVLAAALMTGAVAAALATPALFDAQRDRGLHLTTPPSSHWRSVRIPAQLAPRRAAHPVQLVVASVQDLAIRSTDRPPASRAAVEVPRSSAPTPPPRPRPVSPPVQAPAPDTRDLAAAAPAPAAPATQAPTAATAACTGKSNENGKTNMHCRNKKATRDTANGPGPTAAQPSPPPAAADGQQHDNSGDHARSHDKGKNHDEGKDHGEG
jgi:hypothetical protein